MHFTRITSDHFKNLFFENRKSKCTNEHPFGATQLNLRKLENIQNQLEYTNINIRLHCSRTALSLFAKVIYLAFDSLHHGFVCRHHRQLCKCVHICVLCVSWMLLEKLMLLLHIETLQVDLKTNRMCYSSVQSNKTTEIWFTSTKREIRHEERKKASFA